MVVPDLPSPGPVISERVNETAALNEQFAVVVLDYGGLWFFAELPMSLVEYFLAHRADISKVVLYLIVANCRDLLVLLQFGRYVYC